MNITLSADPELVERTRSYARKHGTTLNRLIRLFMADITGASEKNRAATKFRRLARENAGRSPKGYRFNREEAHRAG